MHKSVFNDVELNKNYNELFISLFEESQTKYLVVDSNLNLILYANKAACEFYKYNHEELKSLKFNELNFNLDNDKEIKDHNFEMANHTIVIHKLANNELVNVEVIKQDIFINNELHYLISINNVTNYIKHQTMITNLFYDSPNPMVILDENRLVVSINKSFESLFEYKLDELYQKTLSDFIAPEKYFDNICEAINDIFRGNIVNQNTVRKTKSNKKIDVNIIGTPYVFNNKVEGALLTFTDINEAIKMKIREGLFTEIIQNNTDGIIITNENKNIEWVNDAFTKITQYTLDEVIGKNPNILKSNVQSKTFYQRMWKRIHESDHWQGIIWNKKKDGVLYPQWLHMFTIRNEYNEIKNYVSIFKNLGEIDTINKKVLLLMQKDPLTSLYNRTYFIDEVNNRLLDKTKTRLMLFLDINNFKMINDTYGHSIGDEVLAEFSKKLLEVFKWQLIGRYGGDEFIIFLKSNYTVEELLNNLKLLNFDITIKDFIIKIKTSIGIVTSLKDGTTLDELIKNADTAMYEAKSSNKQYVFYSDIKDKIKRIK